MARFRIYNQISPLSEKDDNQTEVIKQPDLKSNQEYEGGGATVQGSGGTGPSIGGGTLPASVVSGGSARLSNRDSNPLYRGSREPRFID